MNVKRPVITFLIAASALLVLAACTQEEEGILLPLNIKSDQSVFIFVKGRQTDTLVVSYEKFNQIGSNEYELNFKITKPFTTTFDSLNSTCVPQILNYCNAYPGFFAIVYL